MVQPWERDWSTPAADEQKQPWERDWSAGQPAGAPRSAREIAADFLHPVSAGFEQGMRPGLETARNYGSAIQNNLAAGMLGIQGGVGTFVQAPAANTLAGVTGARALLNRGITNLANWSLPFNKPLEEDADLQEEAQRASRFAAETRAQNVEGGEAGWLNPRTTIARLGLGLQEDARERQTEIQKTLQETNPEFIRQSKAVQDAQGFFPTVAAMAQNPLALTGTMARSAPDMALGLGVARLAATRTLAGAGGAADAAAARAAAAGGDALAQGEAAKAAVDATAKLAVERASQAGMLAESVSSANQARESVYQEVKNLPPEKLAASPRFQKVLREVGGDVDRAREVLANELADQAVTAGLGTMAGSLATRRLFGGDTTAKAVAGTERMTAREIPKNMREEIVEEGIQGPLEDLAQHGAGVQADPTRQYDLGGSVAQNMVAGAAMSGPSTAGRYAQQRIQDMRGNGAQPASDQTKTGLAVPVSPESPPATTPAIPRKVRNSEDAVPASELLGDAPEPSAEEKALTDKPTDLTPNRPRQVLGADTRFSTEAGAKLDASYALMDAGDMVTSHDESLRSNDAYPQELQPRDRERAASATQITGIQARLDPARLGASGDAGTGAPIVGEDGVVESGNARTIALKRVYRANGQQAQDYRGWLRDNAAQFGITPDAVDAMKQPVLVRVRTTPVDRAEFARQANASTVAAMSPSEQARSDANRIEVMDDLKPDDNGDFATSRDFIRRFMARLPVTEQGGMVDAQGQLSSTGYARVRNAVLAKAYGDSPVLTRMVESLDDNTRNISKALLIAAPQVAQARQAIGAGRRFDADITPHLVDAAQELSRLRDAGRTVDGALAQLGLDGDTYTPETRALLRFLADNSRRPRRIAEFIGAYFDALDAAGDPNQGSLLGENTGPTKGELLTAAKRSTDAAMSTPASPGVTPAPVSGMVRMYHGGVDGAASGPVWFTRDLRNAKGWAAKAGDGASVSFVDLPKDHPALGGDEQYGVLPPENIQLPADISARRARFNEGAPGETSIAQDTQRRNVGEAAQGGDGDGRGSQDAAGDRGGAEGDGAAGPGGTAEEAKLDPRAAAVADFQDAMADLADIATKHLRAAMLPEDTPGLMPTLVKLFGAAIKIVGSDLVATTKWVKAQLRANEATKKLVNLIKPETYNKAALQALEGSQIADLATAPAPAVAPAPKPAAAPSAPGELGKGDAVTWSKNGASLKGEIVSGPDRDGNFVVRVTDGGGSKFQPGATVRQAAKNLKSAAAAPEAERRFVTVDGKKLDADAPNFGFAPWPKTLKDGDPLLTPTDKKSTAFYKGQEMPRSRLAELIVEEHFHGKTPAQGRPVAIVMGGGGAAGKGTIKAQLLKSGEIDDANAISLDADDIKASIPEYREIIAAGDSRAAALVHEESSVIAKEVLRRAIEGGYNIIYDGTMGNPGKGNAILRQMKDAPAGYEVRLYGLTIDPITAVVRADGRARKVGRYVPTRDLLMAHKGFMQGFQGYADIADEASLWDTSGAEPVALVRPDLAGNAAVVDRIGYNGAAERAGKINEDGKTIADASPGSWPELQGQAGSDRGRDHGDGHGRGDQGQGGARRRGDGQGREVPGQGLQGQGVSHVDAPDGGAGAQGQVPGAVRGPEGQGRTQRLRQRPEGPDLFSGGQPDDGATPAGELGSTGPDGSGAPNEHGAGSVPGAGAQRHAGVPAGRDIPAKSGRNYAFGPDDLTYEGSWAKKADQNVEAVDLLKKLQTEGRQATRDEQAILAKFVGWGSSEIANTLFGAKAGKQADIDAYLAAKAAIDAGATRLDRYSDAYMAAYQRMAMDARSFYGNPIPASAITPKNFNLTPADLRWHELRQRLKAAMTPEEWAEASRSTQYAHYTSKQIVRSMWAAMAHMGFKGGAILEPGAGIGVFPGLMPEAMANNSAYTGIEFDSITGGILQQLFPDERILVESYMDSKLPKNFYDVSVGNPPFQAKGAGVLSDPEYKKHAFSLHDYFFAKSIDRTKPGGLVTFITSRYTMDKLDDKARAYLAERADLVGAIRLPQTAFKANAGTEVVTDVLFLRKKVPGQNFEHAQPWGKSVPIKVGSNTYNINEYFAAHPEMVLGTHADTGSMYKDREYTVTPHEGDIEQAFAAAVARLPADIYVAERGSAAEAAKVREIDFNPKAKKEGNYYVTDAGALMQREGGMGMRPEKVKPGDVQLIKAFVPLRDALKQAHYDQLNGGDWEASLKALQQAYAKFVGAHGQIQQHVTKIVKTKVAELDDDGNPTGNKIPDEEERRQFPVLDKLIDDPDWTLVAALETLNEDTGDVSESDFLKRRVLGQRTAPQVASAADALLTTLNDLGRVDMPTVAQRLAMPADQAVEALGSAVYSNPEGDWEAADEYLSGNVKRKLEAARAAAKSDKRYERNVRALEAAQPDPKTPGQINVSLGMNWIPGSDYEQFINEITSDTAGHGVKVHVNWNDATRQWSVKEVSGGRTLAATADWGTAHRPVADLLEHGLTGRPIKVTETVGTGSDRKTVFNQAATEAANVKLNELQERFKTWLWSDGERADRLVQIYNDKFNTTVPREFDGRHLTMPGMSDLYNIFDHVKRGAWRIVQSGNTYLAHAVGSGKTFQMVISAMEQKRLGMIKKPMVVVPNHMLKQFATEWQQLYPAARLMVADENNFHTDNRRRFVSRVALSDLDGVIITHSAFKLLDLDPAFKKKMIERELTFMRAALLEAGGDPDKKGKSREPRVKQIEKQIENLEQKLEAAMSGEGKDKNARFDELGVDFLYVDEAHEYRKLDFATSRKVKGISPDGSAKAFDLYMKSQYLEEKTPGRSLVMASGTPITNTTAELYSVQKMMNRQALVDRGIEDFDSWAAMFGREHTDLESNASGAYSPVTRFKDFVNVPELTQMFREFADVVTADQLAQLLGDARPKVKGGARKLIVTPKTSDYRMFQPILAERVKQSKAWKQSPNEPNNPDPMIRIIGDGRLAAIDMRFMDPTWENNPDSKLNRMIDDVIETFKRTADIEYLDKRTKLPEPNKGATMMVFSDLGFGEGVAAKRGFSARAWMEKRLRDAGIPMAKVAFMSDFKKSTEKQKLFRDVNAGRVRILIGSSKNMGTGVNAQQRLLAMFHLDAPWYPADLEQREGRIVRQGNKNADAKREVELNAYSMKASYDEVMWGMLASKQRFIDLALSGDPNVREISDASEASQMQQTAAMLSDDPRILQVAGLSADIERMQRLYQAHEDQRMRHRMAYQNALHTIEFNEARLPEAEKLAGQAQDLAGDKFVAKAGKLSYAERAPWAEALIAQYKDLAGHASTETTMVGSISGFAVTFRAEKVAGEYRAKLVLETPERLDLVYDAGTSPIGVAMRAQNQVADVARLPARMRALIAESRNKMDGLQPRLNAQFPMREQLADAIRERAALEAEIARDSQERPFRVERIATGLGFEVRATSVEGAIEAAVKANGGTSSDWRASEVGPAAAPDGTRLAVGAGGGISQRALAGVAARVATAMPGLPRVHVLLSPAAAPKALQDYIRQRGAMATAEGAFHDGAIYLFASGIADEARAEHVLAEHEAAHAGLRGLLGPKLGQTLQAIESQNASVRRAATAMRAANPGMSVAESVEEVLVDMPSGTLAKLKGWRALVGRVRDWMAGHGFDRLAARLDGWLAGTLTEQQRADLFVADLVREARAFAGRPASGQTRLSGQLSDDLAGQEKWLTSEAKARGYSSIDDLLDRAPEVFEKLATLWREKNPAESLLSPGKVPQVDTPAFKRWFGESKVVDGLGRPLVMYHSTLADITEFHGGKVGAIFAASNHGDAEKMVAERAALANSGGLPVFRHKIKPAEGQNTMPVYVRAVNPFDGDNEKHAQALASWLESEMPKNADLKEGIQRALGMGSEPWMDKDATNLLSQISYENYLILENKHVVKWMKDQGYDGLWVREFDDEGGRNIGVFSSEQIKSAIGNTGAFDLANPDIRLSAAPQPKDADQRAQDIIDKSAATAKPIDALAKVLTRYTGIEKIAGMLYDKGGMLIDRVTPERMKAGFVSDYGVPEAVIDQRAMMIGRQRTQLREAGSLVGALASLTRAESRVAYEWMNGEDTRKAEELMKELPEESVKVLQQVQQMVDKLSREAVRLGQLDPEAFERHRFAYLRRSYYKHAAELQKGDIARRQRAITVLGDQYKGRGMVEKASMKQIQNVAPEWWKRKMQEGKGDTSLKDEKFTRFERRAASGEGTTPMEGVANKPKGKLLEVNYWPAGEKAPAKYADWDNAGTWEVRDTKGADLIVWRDFTKEERTTMGEIDEARFAVAKTLQGMIHDVEVGRYLEWLGQNYAKLPGETIEGEIVDPSERYLDTFKPGQWVEVPSTPIPGTQVKKYGKLAGQFVPGPVWNDLRQVVSGRYKPLGDVYDKVLQAWKISKTALSPAVHTNNVMSNFVMADWHDVTAGHVAKALRIMLAASKSDRMSRAGIADRDAAKVILGRYSDSGGAIGTWATEELMSEQLEPIVAALQAEVNAAGERGGQAEAGVYAALQALLQKRFADAFDSAANSKPGMKVRKGAATMIDAYQAEDDVFRLAAWLKAKEEGATDQAAGKVARKSFLDYSINAPWVQAMRSTAFPFISFTYRAVPLLLETAGKRPHKLMKLMMLAGMLNWLGVLAGGGDDKERKLLPEEKAGRVWGLVPKLVRMPWNDANGSPVYLDIRRWIPVGDVADVGAGHSAVPVLPSLVPGGPVALMFELYNNNSMFTGKPITLETDTGLEKTGKVIDYLWKAFAPNLLGVPGTYATSGVVDAIKGATDKFGREQSVAQALLSSVGIKLGSYPADVLRNNLMAKHRAEEAEIDKNIGALKRQMQTHRMDADEFAAKVQAQNEKKLKLLRELSEKMN